MIYLFLSFLFHFKLKFKIKIMKIMKKVIRVTAEIAEQINGYLFFVCVQYTFTQAKIDDSRDKLINYKNIINMFLLLLNNSRYVRI